MADYPKLGYAGKHLYTYETRRHPYHVLPQTQPLIVVPHNAVEFPDVSFYQGSIDWDVMAQHTKHVIIRAGQNIWVDSEFERNYTEAGKRGLLRGVYWFYDGRARPSQQAAILTDLLKGREPEMEIMADWELVYGGAYEGLPNVMEFMLRVDTGLPARSFESGMYTGYHFFKDHSNVITNQVQYEILKDRPLWLGYYNDPQYVQIPPPWSTWTHWQYGTPVKQYGQKTLELDMNRGNGDELAYTLRYGNGTTPEPPTNGGTMLNSLRVNTAALNGRISLNGTIIFQGGFKLNDILLAGDPVLDPNGVTKWYPVLQCIRAGLNITLPAVPTYASDGYTSRYLVLLGSLPCGSSTPQPKPITFVVSEPGYVPLTLTGTQQPEP